MKRFWGVAVALAFLCPSALAQSRMDSVKAFLEMNDVYQTGVVQGLLVAATNWGPPADAGDAFIAGVSCRFYHPSGRSRTLNEFATEFSRYLSAHQGNADADLAASFTLFAINCKK